MHVSLCGIVLLCLFSKFVYDGVKKKWWFIRSVVIFDGKGVSQING